MRPDLLVVLITLLPVQSKVFLSKKFLIETEDDPSESKTLEHRRGIFFFPWLRSFPDEETTPFASDAIYVDQTSEQPLVEDLWENGGCEQFHRHRDYSIHCHDHGRQIPWEFDECEHLHRHKDYSLHCHDRFHDRDNDSDHDRIHRRNSGDDNSEVYFDHGHDHDNDHDHDHNQDHDHNHDHDQEYHHQEDCPDKHKHYGPKKLKRTRAKKKLKKI